MMQYKRYWPIFLMLVLMAIIAVFIWWYKRQTGGEVVISSISSDGRYVLTTDAKNYAIIWDIKKRSKRIISRNANMYSAYWIKHTPYYMWQDLKTKMIFIVDVKTGKDVEVFHPKFLMYGEAMSTNLKYFVGSDVYWNIFVGKEHYLNLLVAHYDDIPGFAGANKLVNFTFVGNNKILTSGLTSGANDDPRYRTGVFLWDLKTRKPLHDYKGNQSQTFATVSPDGKYVVAGDVQPNVFVWNRKTGKQLVELWPLLGKVIKHDNGITFDRSSTIPIPLGFLSESSPTARTANVLSLKFIDKTHYLRFTTQEYYAILYDVLSPKPSKYLSLGETPAPSTYYLERDQSIDTSASAHILVVGKAFEPGIMVYRYAPKHQTLTKIWDAK